MPDSLRGRSQLGVRRLPVLRLFSPAPHRPRLPEEEVKRKYPKMRWRILESTFIGYATFYLVRNNFPVVAKELGDSMQYSMGEIGDMLAATAIAYGVGKFLMGSVSDRSNPRYFMPTGLLLTALCNFAFGWVGGYWIHLMLWTLNGFVQGMGWAPCGRSLGHWYSIRERGTVFGVWNIAHNVGGGLIGLIAAFSAAKFGGWEYAFYVPGAIAIVGSIYLFIRLRDTPQSEGLPPIEEYKNDYPSENHDPTTHEQELGTRDLFVNYILTNKYLWLFAIANLFVYISRYSMLDWGPTYLKDVKGATLISGGMSTFIYEFAGIASTILMGWVSDKMGGRRGLVSFLCMIPVFIAFAGILFTPPGYLWLDMTFFGMIGFFIYPPVMLLGVAGLDFTSKKAVGTAAGFIGLFGYIGRTIQGKGLGFLAENYSWDVALYATLAASFMAIVLLAFTWRLRPTA